jgi:prefoldin subunit 5
MISEKVEASILMKKTINKTTDDDDSKDDGLDKYSKKVQRRIKKLLDRVEKTEQREQEALRFADSAKKKYDRIRK